MKKKISLFVLLFFALAGLNAQTPYFYYYKGEKQYLDLDTKHIFVSVADENTAQTVGVWLGECSWGSTFRRAENLRPHPYLLRFAATFFV